MRARHLSPSIHAARRPLKRFLPVIRSARPGWLCTRMARPPTMGVPARNTAVPSASPRPVFAPATTKTGITGRKAGGARNIKPFQTIIDFPLTAAIFASRGHTPCVQSAKDTTSALRRLDRNDYGCVTETVRQTSIRWPTSPL